MSTTSGKMSLELLSNGEVLHRCRRLSGAEDLALLNGTQASSALALKGLFRAENNIAAALPVEAAGAAALQDAAA
jgi:histidine ammonia-lyase